MNSQKNNKKIQKVTNNKSVKMALNLENKLSDDPHMISEENITSQEAKRLKKLVEVFFDH